MEKKEFDIEFGGHIMARIVIENNVPIVTMCISGYGEKVELDQIIIREVSDRQLGVHD